MKVFIGILFTLLPFAVSAQVDYSIFDTNEVNLSQHAVDASPGKEVTELRKAVSETDTMLFGYFYALQQRSLDSSRKKVLTTNTFIRDLNNDQVNDLIYKDYQITSSRAPLFIFFKKAGFKKAGQYQHLISTYKRIRQFSLDDKNWLKRVVTFRPWCCEHPFAYYDDIRITYSPEITIKENTYGILSLKHLPPEFLATKKRYIVTQKSILMSGPFIEKRFRPIPETKVDSGGTVTVLWKERNKNQQWAFVQKDHSEENNKHILGWMQWECLSEE